MAEVKETPFIATDSQKALGSMDPASGKETKLAETSINSERKDREKHRNPINENHTLSQLAPPKRATFPDKTDDPKKACRQFIAQESAPNKSTMSKIYSTIKAYLLSPLQTSINKSMRSEQKKELKKTVSEGVKNYISGDKVFTSKDKNPTVDFVFSLCQDLKDKCPSLSHSEIFDKVQEEMHRVVNKRSPKDKGESERMNALVAGLGAIRLARTMEEGGFANAANQVINQTDVEREIHLKYKATGGEKDRVLKKIGKKVGIQRLAHEKALDKVLYTPVLINALGATLKLYDDAPLEKSCEVRDQVMQLFRSLDKEGKRTLKLAIKDAKLSDEFKQLLKYEILLEEKMTGTKIEEQIEKAFTRRTAATDIIPSQIIDEIKQQPPQLPPVPEGGRSLDGAIAHRIAAFAKINEDKITHAKTYLTKTGTALRDAALMDTDPNGRNTIFEKYDKAFNKATTENERKELADTLLQTLLFASPREEAVKVLTNVFVAINPEGKQALHDQLQADYKETDFYEAVKEDLKLGMQAEMWMNILCKGLKETGFTEEDTQANRNQQVIDVLNSHDVKRFFAIAAIAAKKRQTEFPKVAGRMMELFEATQQAHKIRVFSSGVFAFRMARLMI